MGRRARELAISARFSIDALEARNVQTVFDDAVHILRENMRVDFSAVFERSPDGKSLALRAGAGWRPGDVGTLKIKVDEKTSIGRALQLNQPIIISDVAGEKGLSLPKFLRDRGVASSMAVVIPGRTGAFGVLSVDTRSARVFSADDIHFLESIDNILATAISRLQFESELHDAAARLRGIVETAVDGIITIDRPRHCRNHQSRSGAHLWLQRRAKSSGTMFRCSCPSRIARSTTATSSTITKPASAASSGSGAKCAAGARMGQSFRWIWR